MLVLDKKWISILLGNTNIGFQLHLIKQLISSLYDLKISKIIPRENVFFCKWLEVISLVHVIPQISVETEALDKVTN